MNNQQNKYWTNKHKESSLLELAKKVSDKQLVDLEHHVNEEFENNKIIKNCLCITSTTAVLGFFGTLGSYNSEWQTLYKLSLGASVSGLGLSLILLVPYNMDYLDSKRAKKYIEQRKSLKYKEQEKTYE